MKTIELVLSPEEAFSEGFEKIVATQLGLSDSDERVVHLLKRSIDARSRKVIVRVQCQVLLPQQQEPPYALQLNAVHQAVPVVIVGAGPAGLFAALRLIELGYKPIIVERGKDVQERRRDLAAINKDHIVNPDSNYCFGEGGAGTYSDGKLYTRSSKRGNVKQILDILHVHGAPKTILYDAHPHIGTNKLPQLVAQLRNTICESGGEVRFQTKVVDFLLEGNILKGVVTDAGEKVVGEGVILATGHSARDIFQLLDRKKIQIDPKPFALGVRVEHDQTLIDRMQYHCSVDRGEYLPASSYSLVHQVQAGSQSRGVFSFCMCPGGFIVPAATAPGEVVVNGMSPSKRDSRFANSGIVVAISLEDLYQQGFQGALAGVQFQQAIEQQACLLAGGTQKAPAQRLTDFLEGKDSASLLDTSYQPGLESVNLATLFPSFVSQALKEGFITFGKKMKGYLTAEAQLVGVESRTSSPIRIPRDDHTLQHPQIHRLFPCGEGAGYAGGIMSAALDGVRVAEALSMVVKK